VAGLDDPAAGTPVGVVGLQRDLLAAGADVRLEALADGELADVVVVVATVETEPLRVVLVRDRPPDRDRGERLL
jgi:hypothetical protein